MAGAGGVSPSPEGTDVQGSVTAQSESELRQLQGKAALLETLLKLKDNHAAILKESNG